MSRFFDAFRSSLGPLMSPQPKLTGRTTSRAAPAASRKAGLAGRQPDDDRTPLLSRRAWIAFAWGGFTAASAAALAATGRMMCPNVLDEPPQQFKAGFPTDYAIGVDERWKDQGVWLIRTSDDIVRHVAGLYALIAVCTHLGCTPNYLAEEEKFKCPCHGSGFRLSGINFEAPAPRPLARARIVLSDDWANPGRQERDVQYERGQWTDPEAFLRL